MRDCLLNYTESLDQMHPSFWDRKKTVFALNCPNQGLRTIDFWKETLQLRWSILCLPCSSIILEGRQRPLLPIPPKRNSPQNKPNARRKILVWFELSFGNMNICANQPQVIQTETVYFMFFCLCLSCHCLCQMIFTFSNYFRSIYLSSIGERQVIQHCLDLNCMFSTIVRR